MIVATRGCSISPSRPTCSCLTAAGLAATPSSSGSGGHLGNLAWPESSRALWTRRPRRRPGSSSLHGCSMRPSRPPTATGWPSYRPQRFRAGSRTSWRRDRRPSALLACRAATCSPSGLKATTRTRLPGGSRLRRLPYRGLARCAPHGTKASRVRRVTAARSLSSPAPGSAPACTRPRSSVWPRLPAGPGREGVSIECSTSVVAPASSASPPRSAAPSACMPSKSITACTTPSAAMRPGTASSTGLW